jgi:hypothetical protein
MTGVDSTEKHSKGAIAKQFQVILDYNAKLRNDFNQALTFARALEKEDNVDTKHLNVFAQRSGLIGELIKDKMDLAQFYNKLKAMIVDLIKAMELVVEKLDLEREELKKYFDGVHFEEITTLKSYERKAIDYNREERELIFDVFSKVPGLDKLTNTILGTQEKYVMESHQIFEAAANNFIGHYLEFYARLRTENKDNKEVLFNTFVQTIIYMENYIRESSGIIQDFAKGFIAQVSKSPFNKSLLNSHGIDADLKQVKATMILFLKNFFSGGAGSGNTILNGIKSFESKLGIENGRISKPYKDANEEDKLDDAFRGWLKLLFDGAKIIVVKDKEEKEAKDVIEKIIPKKTDVNDLFKTFDRLFSEFTTTYNSLESKKQPVCNINKNLIDLNLLTREGDFYYFEDLKDGKDKGKKFKEYSDEGALKLVTDLQDIISDMKDQKKAFKTFLEYNSGVDKVFKKGDKKIEDDDEKLNEAEIRDIESNKRPLYEHGILNTEGEVNIDGLGENIGVVMNFIKSIFGDVPGNKESEYSRFSKSIKKYGKASFDESIKEELLTTYKENNHISDLGSFFSNLLTVIDIKKIG